MVLDHAGEHPSRWAAVTSIAAKIGCTPQTLHDWVTKAEVDSGQRAGVPTDTAEKLKLWSEKSLPWMVMSWRTARRAFGPHSKSCNCRGASAGVTSFR